MGIRIVFLAQAPKEWWPMHSLYEACRADGRFEASVVSLEWGPWMGIHENSDALLGSLGIEPIDGRGSLQRLASLRPDVVVTTNPYDQFCDTAYRSEELTQLTRVMYIPYGFDVGDASGRLSAFWYGQPLQRRAWRIVASAPSRVSQWVQHAGVPPHHVAGLGLPVTDQTHRPAGPGVTPTDVRRDGAERFKVLYTPHHSLEDWCTFTRHGPTLRAYVDAHDDTFLVFRPHPGLAPKLEELGTMTSDALAGALGVERVHYDTSDDFYSTLGWVDVLVSDASSMIFLFAPTGKPIIYLDRDDGAGLDPLTQAWVSEACYVARSGEELTATLDRLRSGLDPLAAARRARLEGTDAFVFADDAGGRVSRYLADELR